jgi:hypothetical protein
METKDDKRYLHLWKAHTQLDHPMLRMFPSCLTTQGAKAQKGIPSHAVVVLFLQAFSATWSCVCTEFNLLLGKFVKIFKFPV